MEKSKSKSTEFNSKQTEIVTIAGATSSKLELDFHDLPYAGLASAARRFFYGRKRHGRFNWRKGNSRFAEERLNHAFNHLALFCEERQQADLDAALCNLMMVAHYYDTNILSKTPVQQFMGEKE